MNRRSFLASLVALPAAAVAVCKAKTHKQGWAELLDGAGYRGEGVFGVQIDGGGTIEITDRELAAVRPGQPLVKGPVRLDHRGGKVHVSRVGDQFFKQSFMERYGYAVRPIKVKMSRKDFARARRAFKELHT